MSDTAQQKQQDALHLAMTRSGIAAQYFAMAWAKDAANGASNWPTDHGVEELKRAAEALGFTLVKFEAVK